MICSLHQPNYIPYLGLFNKIKESDIFVFYDTAQYAKGDYHNRNTIKGSNGKVLLTLPVSVELGQEIKDVTFNKKILKKHLKTIEQSYKKSKYFDEYIDKIRDIYSYEGNNLSQFNTQAIKTFCEILDINTQFVVLSEQKIKIESNSTDALVDICKLVGAKSYISGAGGKNYIEKEKFDTNNIELSFQNFEHPIYEQLWGDFIPYMSIIDVILNEGVNAKKHL